MRRLRRYGTRTSQHTINGRGGIDMTAPSIPIPSARWRLRRRFQRRTDGRDRKYPGQRGMKHQCDDAGDVGRCLTCPGHGYRPRCSRLRGADRNAGRSDIRLLPADSRRAACGECRGCSSKTVTLALAILRLAVGAVAHAAARRETAIRASGRRRTMRDLPFLSVRRDTSQPFPYPPP